MATAYPPSIQSDHLDAAVTTGSIDSHYPLHTYTHPAHGESQPPSPNGISAAAILATMSDSRPPTSHADPVGHLEEEDTETGGISLASEWEGMNTTATVQAMTHYPAFFEAPEPPWQSGYTLSHLPYAGLDDHAAALEALTMESQAPPPVVPQSLPETYVAPPHNSTPLPEFAGGPYDDHLTIPDNNAFLDLPTFFLIPTLPLKMSPGALDFGAPAETIRREDLDGDKCDFQGIDWSERSGRENVRACRVMVEEQRSLYNQWHGNVGVPQKCPRLQHSESFFSYRRMNTRHRAHYPHFQLRNVMTATSRNDIYYATKEGIMRTDAPGASHSPVIDLRRCTANGNSCQITTLAASDDVLVAGGFEGDYYIANLSSADDNNRFDTGLIRDWPPDAKSYITNHVHLFNSRHTYTPQAVFCSNDWGLRVLDCETDTFRSSFSYPSAVNCSDTSPDGRLRVVVGDFHETLITNAETGKPFETLKAHTDFAFACAWSDDGLQVASASQDSSIAIWDARYWNEPIAKFSTELAVPRSLRFSPIGSGPPVLIAAEADDYINIINAQTFDSKQVFDFFGPVAGISMTPDGQSLFVANADKRFGGMIELERTGWGETKAPRLPHDAGCDGERMDLDRDDGLDLDHRVPCGFGQRDRRGLDLGALVV